RQRLPGHPDVSDVISSYPQAARPRHAHAAAGAPRLPRAATDASLIPRRKYMRPSSTLKRLALALVLLLAAFGSAQAQTEIRIAIPGEGDTLDPAYMSFVNSFAVATNVYSGLVRYAPGTIDLMPDLATEWAVSDDGLTWTFAIRDDVVWQKGYGKLVAQDIVDSFERVRDPATGSRWQGELAIIESITAPDDTTVVFQLKQPSAAFLHNVAAF